VHPNKNTLVAGRYCLERLLGAGGTGVVWLAFDRMLDCRCALKLLDAELAGDEGVQLRCLREARAAAQIRSPNVVDVFEWGIWEGTPFIAMEFLEGEDLDTRLAREGRLDPLATYEIVAQVARALSRAHAAGIVHRDIKPDNIFLVPGDEHEVAKVLDFGIARCDAFAVGEKATQTGYFVGTPAYASPEQARCQPVDFRSDLWSLAIVVFVCLTGRRPFESEALGELMGMILYEPIPKLSDHAPNLPKCVDAWWERAAARNPQERFQSAKELVDSLALALGKTALPVPSLSPRASEPPAPPRRPLPRKKKALALGAAGAALLGILLLGSAAFSSGAAARATASDPTPFVERPVDPPSPAEPAVVLSQERPTPVHESQSIIETAVSKERQPKSAPQPAKVVRPTPRHNKTQTERRPLPAATSTVAAPDYGI